MREPNLFFSLLESVTPRHAGCELCRLILCLFESPPQDFACFVYYYGVWRDGTHSEWAAPTQHKRAPQDPLHSSPAPRREKKKTTRFYHLQGGRHDGSSGCFFFIQKKQNDFFFFRHLYQHLYQKEQNDFFQSCSRARGPARPNPT